jgi:hypothetical protein
MRIADMRRSDVDLAGLMLRCRESVAEVLIVLVRPLSARVRPDVTMMIAGQTTRFTASVVPPLTAVLLPDIALPLVTGAQQSDLQVLIDVGDKTSPITGTIELAGVRGAYDALIASCQAR